MGRLKANVGGTWTYVASQGPVGPPGPSTPSAQTGNDLTTGNDGLLYFDHEVKAGLKLYTKLAAEWVVPVDGNFATIGWPAPSINDGNWVAGSYGWKAPKAGWVEASVIIRCANASAVTYGRMVLSIWCQGVEYRIGDMAGAQQQAFTASTSIPIQVAANDVINTSAYVSGAGGVYKAVEAGSQFSIRWIQ